MDRRGVVALRLELLAGAGQIDPTRSFSLDGGCGGCFPFRDDTMSVPSTGRQTTATVPVASAGQAAWRTRQLVAAMLTAGLLLGGVALVAAQSGPNAVDVDATL